MFENVTIPACPNILLEVEKLIARDGSPQELARLVQLDAAVAAAVLRCANSAAFYNGVTVDNVTTAVLRLGMTVVQNVCLCVSIRSMGRAASPIWFHSARVGACAYVVHKALGLPGASEAMTVGVLHDLGRIVAHGECDGPETAIITADVARAWKLPPTVIELSSLHWELPAVGRLSPLVAAHSIADALAGRESPEGIEAHMDYLNVTPQTLLQIAEAFSVEIDGLERIFL